MMGKLGSLEHMEGKIIFFVCGSVMAIGLNEMKDMDEWNWLSRWRKNEGQIYLCIWGLEGRIGNVAKRGTS